MDINNIIKYTGITFLITAIFFGLFCQIISGIIFALMGISVFYALIFGLLGVSFGLLAIAIFFVGYLINL